MLKVIKNKGKMVQAYELGSDSEVIKKLMEAGKIVCTAPGKYEIHSQEAVKGNKGGEIASAGDWIKVDGRGYPYPNSKEYFLAHHRHMDGDNYEQVPTPLNAWNAECGQCPEIDFLVGTKRLLIDEVSTEKRYSAKLWGTEEAANADAVIVFYSISYDATGAVIDADFNFVARDEFEKTYTVIG